MTSKCLKVVRRINRIIVTRICRLRHRELKKKEKKGFGQMESAHVRKRAKGCLVTRGYDRWNFWSYRIFVSGDVNYPKGRSFGSTSALETDDRLSNKFNLRFNLLLACLMRFSKIRLTILMETECVRLITVLMWTLWSINSSCKK